MADAAYSLVADDAAGNRIDEWSMTRAGVLVRRASVVIADHEDPDAGMNVTPYGTAEAAPRTTLFVDDLYNGLDAGIWDTTTGTSSGTATAGSGVLTLSAVATTTGNAISVAQRFGVPQYSGAVNVYTAGVRIPTVSVTNNSRKWGVYDTQNGFFFQVVGGVFSIVTRRGASDTTIALASFSDNPSFAMDNAWHRWEIEFTTLGVIFSVDGKSLHRITAASITTVLTNDVNLPVKFENINTGTAGAIATMEVRQVNVARVGAVAGTIEAPARTQIILTADTLTAAATDTLLSFNKIVGRTVTAVTNTAGYIVPSGRTFRLQTFIGTIHASSAVAQSGAIILRAATGTLSASSQAYLRIGPQSRTAAVINSAVSFQADIPGGLDFPSATAITFSGMAETTAGRISFSAVGYEF